MNLLVEPVAEVEVDRSHSYRLTRTIATAVCRSRSANRLQSALLRSVWALVVEEGGADGAREW
jgi:hypothetical protein